MFLAPGSKEDFEAVTCRNLGSIILHFTFVDGFYVILVFHYHSSILCFFLRYLHNDSESLNRLVSVKMM